MKVKLNTDLFFNSIAFCYVLYLGLLCLKGVSHPYPFYTSLAGPTLYIDNLKPIDAVIPDTISYKDYKKLKDSISTIRDLKNGDSFLRGLATNFNDVIGTSSSFYCDTCSLKWYKTKIFGVDEEDHIQNYVKLLGWKLNIKTKTEKTLPNFIQSTMGVDSVHFYVDRGQSYVRKLMPLHLKNSHDVKYRMVDVPVKFRYHQQSQCLLIPVSKSIKNTLDVIVLSVGIIWIIFILVVIFEFIKFLINLSKGNAFANQTINRLRFITRYVLIYPIAIFLFNLLLKLIFHSYFTSDVILSDSIWSNSWKIMLIGVVFSMLYKAFKQGKSLQDEQDLTV